MVGRKCKRTETYGVDKERVWAHHLKRSTNVTEDFSLCHFWLEPFLTSAKSMYINCGGIGKEWIKGINQKIKG
jgi:hypothetical protein